MWYDMRYVLQQQLGSLLAFLQLLKQQTGLQVPEGNTDMLQSTQKTKGQCV